MNLIDQKLTDLKSEKRTGYMTHVIVGYPTIEDTVSMVECMAKSGVDFVELQIPFSDPLADGPTIMKACEDALERGVRIADAFSVASKLSKKTEIPLLFMAYYNTVFKYGVEKFCRDSRKSGISGLIVPDMPIEEEENEGFSRYAKKYDLHVIRVVSPASTEIRLKKNIKATDSFLYCTARQGTTGNQKELDPKVVSYLKNVKKISSVPIAVGFGIKNRQDIMHVQKYADIAIIGSAIVSLATKNRGKALTKSVKSFLSSIRV